MPNKLTEAAGLTFNVNGVKKGIAEYFATNGEDVPMLKKIHIALAAAIESTCRHLCRNVCTITRIDKSGMRTVTRPLLRLSVQTNRELSSFFDPIINNTFVKNRGYIKELPVTKDEIKEVIDSVNEKLNFKPKAFNLLCFMLVEVFNTLLADSTMLIEYAKKKSLDDRSVEFAARMLFRNCDEYRSTIIEDMAQAVTNYEEVKEAEAEAEEEAEDDVSDDDDDDDDEIEVVAKKKTNKKTATKKTAKRKSKSKHVEEVSEDEDSEDDIEDDIDDELDESSDEEVEAKPVKRRTSKKTSKRTSRR